MRSLLVRQTASIFQMIMRDPCQGWLCSCGQATMVHNRLMNQERWTEVDRYITDLFVPRDAVLDGEVIALREGDAARAGRTARVPRSAITSRSDPGASPPRAWGRSWG